MGDYVETPDGLVVVGMVPDNSNSSQRLPGTLRAGRISAPQYSLTTATLASLSRTTGTLLYNGLSPLIVGEWGRHRAAMTKIPGGFDFYSESVRGVGQSEGGSTIHWGHYTSPNGTDWTRRANGLNDIKKFPGIRGLAHGAGRYVAVGLGSSPGLPSSDDRIYTSVDGENYSAVSLAGITPALTEGLTGLAFANGMFVATGNEGRILRSTDGLNWETVLNSGGGGWNRVRFLGAHWTLAGDAGRVAFSPDGRVWTIKRTGVVNDLNDIALRDDTYLAVGNNGMVLRSLFTPPPLPPSIDTQPATATVSARSALLLSVTATRATSYQWKFEGEKIPGATNAQYRIPAVDVTHAGRYTVVVGNTAGSVESAAATITVTRLDLYPGILVAGPVGAVYRVEWTTEATGDGGWTLLRAITLDQPSYVVIDPQPANQPRRFYRVVPGP